MRATPTFARSQQLIPRVVFSTNDDDDDDDNEDSNIDAGGVDNAGDEDEDEGGGDTTSEGGESKSGERSSRSESSQSMTDEIEMDEAKLEEILREHWEASKDEPVPYIHPDDPNQQRPPMGTPLFDDWPKVHPDVFLNKTRRKFAVDALTSLTIGTVAKVWWDRVYIPGKQHQLNATKNSD